MRLVTFLISKTSSTILAFALAALLIACSPPTHLPVDAHPSPQASAEEASQPSGAAGATLKVLADVPLTGGTTRLDYQSLDSSTGRLCIAHLGSDLMTVFDVNKQTIVGDVKDLNACAWRTRRT